MRKLGLIGGMSWFSTALYYNHLNRMVQKARGSGASAPLLIESLDFENLSRLQAESDWQRAAGVLADSARNLEQAGATAILICANSMYRVYDEVAEAVSVPVIHIADAVAAKVKAAGMKKVALLGTRNVMTESFYRERLLALDIELLPPEARVVEAVDRIIYDELMQGKVARQSERDLKTVVTNLERDGAEAVVLACTELEMIVDVDANVLPIFDSTVIHAGAGAEWILG